GSLEMLGAQTEEGEAGRALGVHGGKNTARDGGKRAALRRARSSLAAGEPHPAIQFAVDGKLDAERAVGLGDLTSLAPQQAGKHQPAIAAQEAHEARRVIA